MAPKSSALTAALSGAPGTEPPAHHHHHGQHKAKSFLDPAAFPCLAYAAEVDGIEGVPEGESPEEVFNEAEAKEAIVGSVPISFPVGSNLVVSISVSLDEQIPM